MGNPLGKVKKAASKLGTAGVIRMVPGIGPIASTVYLGYQGYKGVRSLLGSGGGELPEITPQERQRMIREALIAIDLVRRKRGEPYVQALIEAAREHLSEKAIREAKRSKEKNEALQRALREASRRAEERIQSRLQGVRY